MVYVSPPPRTSEQDENKNKISEKFSLQLRIHGHDFAFSANNRERKTIVGMKLLGNIAPQAKFIPFVAIQRTHTHTHIYIPYTGFH